MVATPVVVAPITMKDVSLIFGPAAGAQNEYRTQVEEVTFSPTSSALTWTGLGLNTYTDVSAPTWLCNLTYAQDWEDDESLSMYLYTHEGEVIEVTFAPKNGGRIWTGKIIASPGAIGGPVNTVATASVSLGMPEKPIPSALLPLSA